MSKKLYHLFFIFCINTLFAQTPNCDLIKKENGNLKITNTTLQSENNILKETNTKLNDENRYLKQKIQTIETLSSPSGSFITSFSDKFEIRVVSVLGSRIEQSVKIDLIISHQLVNQTLSFSCYNNEVCQAFDEAGNQIIIKDMSIGNEKSGFSSSVSNSVLTDTPIKCSIKILSVLPGTTRIKSFKLRAEYSNLNSNDKNIGFLTFQNLPITW